MKTCSFVVAYVLKMQRLEADVKANSVQDLLVNLLVTVDVQIRFKLFFYFTSLNECDDNVRISFPHSPMQ